MIDKKKVAGAILAGVLTVAGATSAFAAGQAANEPQAARIKQTRKIDVSDMSTKIKSAIEGLVSAGTITQEQADAVTKAYTPAEGKGMVQNLRKSPMTELVTAGTLTQTQVDAINAAVKTGIGSDKSMEDIFNGLVAEGTLTEAQKEAVEKVFPNKNALTKRLDGNKGITDRFVASGTITQEQADAIQAALKSGKASQVTIKGILDEMVKAGTITQAQEDAILKVFPIKGKKLMNRGGHTGILDKLVTSDSITQQQADAYTEAMKAAREAKKSEADVLKELVEAGTITQVQADAMQKIFTPGEGRGIIKGINKGSAVKLRISPLDELVKAGTITQAQADAVNTSIKAALVPSDKK